MLAQPAQHLRVHALGRVRIEDGRLVATGLVKASRWSFSNASLLNKFVRVVRTGRPPGVVVSDLAK
jgi:hypothetical protein